MPSVKTMMIQSIAVIGRMTVDRSAGKPAVRQAWKSGTRGSLGTLADAARRLPPSPRSSSIADTFARLPPPRRRRVLSRGIPLLVALAVASLGVGLLIGGLG